MCKCKGNNNSCGCKNGHFGLKRRFKSNEERKENLEKYRDELLKEVKGIEEVLSEE